MVGNTMVRVREGAKSVAKHPATPWTVGITGALAGILAVVSPIINAQPVKDDMAKRVITDTALKTAVTELTDDVAAVKRDVAGVKSDVGDLKVIANQLTVAVIGSPPTLTNPQGVEGINLRLQRIEQQLRK